MSGKDGMVEVTYHEVYLKIAAENCQNAKRIEAEWVSRRNSETPVTYEEYEYYVLNGIERCVIVATVFTALAAEAFINHYAIIRLSKNYLVNYLNNLRLVPKWVVIPRVVTGKQLDQGSKAFEQLRTLVKRRNELVHYKTRRISIWDEDSAVDVEEELEEAQGFILAVKELVLELGKLDPQADSKWVKDINLATTSSTA